MDSRDAASTVDELDRLRDRVRQDRRPASVPLTVLAAATALYASLQWVSWAAERVALPVTMLFWMVAAPVCFAVIARWYRQIEARRGVGTPRRTFVLLAVVSGVSVFVLPVFALPMGIPFAVVGLIAVVLGARERSAYLVAGGVVLGSVGLLEELYVFSNRVHELAGRYVEWASPLVWTILTAAMVWLAIAARQSERAR